MTDLPTDDMPGREKTISILAEEMNEDIKRRAQEADHRADRPTTWVLSHYIELLKANAEAKDAAIRELVRAGNEMKRALEIEISDCCGLRHGCQGGSDNGASYCGNGSAIIVWNESLAKIEPLLEGK